MGTEEAGIIEEIVHEDICCYPGLQHSSVRFSSSSPSVSLCRHQAVQCSGSKVSGFSRRYHYDYTHNYDLIYYNSHLILGGFFLHNFSLPGRGNSCSDLPGIFSSSGIDRINWIKWTGCKYECDRGE
jgi:hypothetical protein